MDRNRYTSLSRPAITWAISRLLIAPQCQHTSAPASSSTLFLVEAEKPVALDEDEGTSEEASISDCRRLCPEPPRFEDEPWEDMAASLSSECSLTGREAIRVERRGCVGKGGGPMEEGPGTSVLSVCECIRVERRHSDLVGSGGGPIEDEAGRVSTSWFECGFGLRRSVMMI